MSELNPEMTNHKDEPQREILPIPDRPHVGLVTYTTRRTRTPRSRRSSPLGRRRVRRTCWSSSSTTWAIVTGILEIGAGVGLRRVILGMGLDRRRSSVGDLRGIAGGLA